jgi:hypothetical protein
MKKGWCLAFAVLTLAATQGVEAQAKQVDSIPSDLAKHFEKVGSDDVVYFSFCIS